MSDPKSFVRKAKRTTLQEGGNFLKNINLFVGINRRKNGRSRAAKGRESPCLHYTRPNAQLQETQKGSLTADNEIGAQLLHISSESSSTSCEEEDEEEDGGSCNSPVVRYPFIPTLDSSSEDVFEHNMHLKPQRTPAPFLARIGDERANSASLATIKNNDSFGLRSRPLKRQPSGVKKEHAASQVGKGQLRRIHSMYASQKEVSKGLEVPTTRPLEEPESECDTECPAYESKLERSGIPHYFDNKTDDNLPRISVETLVTIMDGDVKKQYDTVHIVDCRFEYEYQGGHIGDAINISSQTSLESVFIHNRKNYCKSHLPSLVIFHCEFSSYRGPIMASHLRNCDRMLNYDNYPKLHYPDILIVEGGYKSFFEKYSHRCFPRRYIEMGSQDHIDKCESEMEKFRRNSKRVATKSNSLHSLNRCNVTSRASTPLRPDFASQNQSCFSNNKKHERLSLSHYTTKSNLSFKYEAPPKLSLSQFSMNSGSGSPSSVSSSAASSRALLLDELQDDLESSDFDNISLEGNEHPHTFCGGTDPVFALNSPKASLLSSIFQEEEVDSTYPSKQLANATTK
ncbi:LAQU0S01e08262g1_1 [Lachancea quebecensis]|uniref:M-phase inducer phosphatase n=1 Tax=Lachancea quebecensis TaxID=1654605 RepID=A0A0P1KLD4_9SACH|nr:LAQU0S01e08262g1_1 [Lachancea quebecensis]